MRVIVAVLRARARAGIATLIALAAVAALAAGLAVVVVGAVRAVESDTIVTAIADASGDRDRIAVRFDGDDPAAVAVPAAVEGALAAIGAPGALATVSDPRGGTLEYTVDPARFTGDAAIALVAGLPDLADRIEDRADLDVQVSGGLRSTLLDLRAGIDARRGPAAVGLVVFGLVAAVVVATVAIEPVRARTSETRLLRARGARSRTLLSLAGVETVVCAGLGAAIGAIVGTAAVTAATGVVVGPSVGAIAGAAVVLVALASALIATGRGLARRSTRADATAGIGLAVLAAVLTGVALWQFVSAGTPVIDAGGGLALDPVVAAAPALTLALAALLVVLIATPLARGLARLLERSRGVSPVLPVRLAARRPERHALTTTVVAFAVGAITLAGAYQGTAVAIGDAPEALRVGADLRVTALPEGADPALIATIDGVQATMGVRSADARVADGRVPVFAVDSDALGDVMLDAAGAIDPDALSSQLAVPAAGVTVPSDAGELGIRIVVADPPPFVDHEGLEWDSAPPAVVASIVLESADGAIAELHATNAETLETWTDDSGTFVDSITHSDRTETVTVPPGGPWRIALVGAINGGWGIEADATVALSTAAGPLDVSGYRLRGDGAVVEAAGTGLRFELPLSGQSDPPTPYAAPAEASTVAPAAVTAGLARSLSLEVGDRMSAPVADFGGALDLEVAGILPVLPGSPTGEGVLVDRGAASMTVGQPLPATEVWIATDDPSAVSEAVVAQLPGARTDAADHRAASAAAGTAWAFVLAAAAAAVLALVVLLLRRTRSRADDRELALLAVLGAGRSGARGARVAEDLFALAMGVVGGLVAGAATAWLVVPPLVRAAYVDVPDGFPIALQAAPLPLAAAVVASVALFALVVASVGAPAALSPLMREDE